MSKHWDVLAFGTVTVDDLLYVDHFPEPGTKMALRAMRRQGGGQAATALVAAARHGARAALGGVLGLDDLSNYIVRDLETEGVDCAPVIRDPAARAMYAVILVDPAGGRTIVYDQGGFREPAAGEIDPAWITGSKVLQIDQHVPLSGLHAARIARSAGVPVIADLEYVPAAVRLEELLCCIDHLIVSEEFARGVAGPLPVASLVAALRSPHRPATVVTAGEQGCWYAERDGEVIHFPAFRVQVVDTTGSGDVFHGAYAAALARGEPVARCIAIASATSALKATQPGGRSGIPHLTAVENLLAQ